MSTARLVSSGLFVLLSLGLSAGCGKKDGPASNSGSDAKQKQQPQPGPSAPTGEAEVAAKAEALKRLTELGKALHAYEKEHKQFPAGIVGPNNELGLSWRVQILPYLGEGELYKQFKLEEAWDSAHNKPLVAKMPKVFESAGKPADPGTTYMQAFYGNMAFLKVADSTPKGGKEPASKGAPGAPVPGRRITEITDGTSNTIMLVEAYSSAVWSKPEDLPFVPFGRGLPPVFPLGGAFRGGYHVLMCDGAPHFIPSSIPEEAVGPMVTINRGEALSKDVSDILFPGKPKKPKDEEPKKKPPENGTPKNPVDR